MHQLVRIVTEENTLTSIYFVDRVVYPCALLTSYNLCFKRQERFFNNDVSQTIVNEEISFKENTHH